jgi:hypothetical protein
MRRLWCVGLWLLGLSGVLTPLFMLLTCVIVYAWGTHISFSSNACSTRIVETTHELMGFSLPAMSLNHTLGSTF